MIRYKYGNNEYTGVKIETEHATFKPVHVVIMIANVNSFNFFIEFTGGIV